MPHIDDFLVADMGELTEPPDVISLDWEPWLSGGREIFMTRIQQPQTYGCTLWVAMRSLAAKNGCLNVTNG